MIIVNKDFMFLPVLRTEGTSLSPLQRAFELNDSHMWMLFLNAVSDNKERLHEFSYQFKTRPPAIILQPLFDAYEEYLAQHMLWLEGKLNNMEIDSAWQKLGKKQ